MDLLTQLNRAMDYVEEHIPDDIALSNVSTVTAYSPYHFGRLFYYIAEMPLSEYIRKRKLSLAAMELQSNDIKVIDLAVKYGYDSADSFTRAFVKQHGVTPTTARKAGITLKIFPPLTFQIQIKEPERYRRPEGSFSRSEKHEGVQEMNWRIEQKEAFEIFGIEKVFKNDEWGKIPTFWDETREDGSRIRLVEQAGVHVPMAICGHIDDHSVHLPPANAAPLARPAFLPVHPDEFPYMICCEVKEGCHTDGFKVVQVPKATWAVFRTDGMKDHDICQIPELFHRAYSEWLPSSGYDKADGLDMEIYGDSETNEIYEEVWIAVVKK